MRVKMRGYRTFLANVLSILQSNIRRTGDPLGMKHSYWTEWAKGLELPRSGRKILLTARMYQMLPYITQMTGLVASAKPFLSRGILGNIVNAGNSLVGEKLILWKARSMEGLKIKGTRTLRGIVAALAAIGYEPAYLYEDEPYSGALLYDLGLDEDMAQHVSKVYKLLKSRKVEEVICVDPHTTFMLKEVYPDYLDNYDIKVNHYLDILSENRELLEGKRKKLLQGEFVIHDPCFLARNLGIMGQARKVLASLGVTVLEPENNQLNTVCCGGPLEYAFPDLTEKISKTRIEELHRISSNVVTTCPICLINLSRYEKDLGIKVTELGELLLDAFQ